jgi:3-hydroxyacyl-CoA dehydrogenase/enoyl-CoA hydratase/3-hydroxybutyryl-CoA epimerase
VDEVVPQAILREVAEKRAAELADGGHPSVGAPGPSPGARQSLEVARVALEENPVGRLILFRQARSRLLARTRGNYPAPERALDAVRVGFEKGLAAGYEEESVGFGELCPSPQAKELIQLFFAQGALKKDSGVEDGVQPRTVDRLAVIGGGLMGAGIAAVSIQAGIRVRLRDKDDAAVGRARAQIDEIVAERVKRRRGGPSDAQQTLARLTTALDYSGMTRAGLFIEAVFEDLSLKRRVLREVEGLAGPEAIFASNTSSLPIAEIAAESARPENVVGMHYFSPVHRMPLLEVVRHPKASPIAVATAVSVGKRQGKHVIVVNDGPGFYTTRILAPYIGEAGFLLEAGATVEEIDEALVDWGFPVGPLQLLDEVGIDVADKIARVLGKAFGARLAPPAGFAKLIEGKRLGRKNRSGFYLYGDSEKTKRVDSTVYATLGATPRERAVLPVEIAERLSLAMINEAAYCLGDGVLRSARDGDLGAIFGLGYPPFRGGPFRTADARGAKALVAKLEALQRRLGDRFSPAPLLVAQARDGTRFYP